MEKYFALFLLVLIISCSDNKGEKYTPIVDEILNNDDSFFYIDFNNYPSKNKKLPIGIFDSGTGGLTVLDAMITRIILIINLTNQKYPEIQKLIFLMNRLFILAIRLICLMANIP